MNLPSSSPDRFPMRTLRLWLFALLSIFPPGAGAASATAVVPALATVHAATLILEAGSSGAVTRTLATATVVDTLGGILTAFHCITGKSQVLLQLPPGSPGAGAAAAGGDRAVVTAEVVATLPQRDLAYLRVIAADAALVPPPLPMDGAATAPLPAIGTPVYALGNPLGQALVLSSGIVAAHPDTTAEPGSAESHLLVDALVAPGSSGGPVVTADGRWLGMIVGKAVVDNAVLDLGLVVPASVIVPFITEAAQRRVHGPRPWVGIEVTTMNAAMAAVLATPRVGGVVVTRVAAGSPGNVAGLAAMDVITAVDNHLVRTAEEFAGIIASHTPGEELHISVSTDGHARILTLPIAAQATDQELNGTLDAHASLADLSTLGLSVAAITSAGGEVLVAVDVIPGGPAARAGIEPGDLIDLVGRHPASIAILRAEVRRHDDTTRALLIRLQRQRQRPRIVAIEW